MKKTMNARFFWGLVIFGLMGQVAWVVENMYFNVFLYKMFRASPEDISLMVSASAVAATVTTVLMGALSDRVGKRKLFISLGYLCWGISILAFLPVLPSNLRLIAPAANLTAMGITLTVILDCVMTFFGSTANDAAFNAWLTDAADPRHRGQAEGINAMMPLVAILAVFGGFMAFDLDKESSWQWIFLIIGALVLLIGVLGFFILDEPKLRPVKMGYFASVIHGFLPSTVKRNSRLYLALAGFVLFNTSIQIFMPYLILYYEVSLGMTDYVLVMAPAILLASLFTAFWGRFYDKKGFSLSCGISLVLLCAGYLILALVKAKLPVFLGSLLMMCGYLSGMASFGALIRDRIPKGKAGMFQGVRIFSQVLLPGLIGPSVGARILQDADTLLNSDGTTSFIPHVGIFWGALAVALTVIPFLFTEKKKDPPKNPLFTPYEKDLKKGEIPYTEYPRPLLKRDSYLNLNGPWQLTVKKEDKTLFHGRITVPFPPESRLSGVERETKGDETLIYERRFTLPEGFQKDRVILHFGAAEQLLSLFVNGKKAGEHALPYLPFSFDVTPFLKEGENTLRAEVRDPLDHVLPYGKQKRKRGGMWYTPVSGLWQTVWMESLPKNAVTALSAEAEGNRVTFTVTGGEKEKTLILSSRGQAAEYRFTGSTLSLTLPQIRTWCPEDPFLYRYTVITGKDRVESYFAFRKIEIHEIKGKKRILLNGKPLFLHGLLDQGYFSDGIFLPAKAQGFRDDALAAKALGFNMLRKHIKLEPQLFYSYCDELGILVLQDMPNNGRYDFFTDTALPTAGIKRGIRKKRSQKEKEAYFAVADGIVEALRPHPSVVYYTLFNEGWGQFDADEVYERYKKKDPTRLYDATSGWFWETKSDVDSHHVYFKPVKLPYKGERPVVLSEFGGYSLALKEHRFNPTGEYGYRRFTKSEEFKHAILTLYEKEILPAARDGLCGAVLTQLSDVEDETNGLLTYDRVICKVREDEMRPIARALQRAAEE